MKTQNKNHNQPLNIVNKFNDVKLLTYPQPALCCC